MKFNPLSSPRITIVSFFVVFFSSILIAKLFFIQVVHSSYYSEAADRQYSTPSSDIFERGSIYFSNKDGGFVSAAVQTLGYKLAINPTKIQDAENAFLELSALIQIDHDDYVVKANKKNDTYEEIAHRLTKEVADNIASLKIPGVSIYKEKWRFYPGEGLSSNVLGLVGYKGNDLGGRYGLEKYYNDVLSRSKDNPYVNFFAEVFSNINDSLFSDEQSAGDIVTTIEPAVEGELESKLEEVNKKYNPESLGGIIMNPVDGSIYAMAARPNFNPNDFSRITDPSTFSNPIVENIFEFGSVVKPLVMAGALNEKAVTVDTTYNDKGYVEVDGTRINNFDLKGRGPNTSMQEVLNQSLNTGMVFVSQKLGKEKERDYLLSYGIKEKTGIDLPNETHGLASSLDNMRDIDMASASFGQSIAWTPIGITRALASLSNGGSLVVPHIVKKIKYENGTTKELTYSTKQTMISPETADEITRMLVAVMDKSLKGGQAKFEHYSVAVKTGTAQVANRETGGYYEDKHTHSFFGYFPAYNPKFIVFLYAVDPKGVPYASQTWADPFLDIAKFLINYYDVPPDR